MKFSNDKGQNLTFINISVSSVGLEIFFSLDSQVFVEDMTALELDELQRDVLQWVQNNTIIASDERLILTLHALEDGTAEAQVNIIKVEETENTNMRTIALICIAAIFAIFLTIAIVVTKIKKKGSTPPYSLF